MKKVLSAVAALLLGAALEGCSQAPPAAPPAAAEQTALLRQIDKSLQELAKPAADEKGPASTDATDPPPPSELSALEDRLSDTNRKLDRLTAAVEAQSQWLSRIALADDQKYQQILQQGQYLQAAGDQAGALREYERGIQLRPELFSAYNLRGALHLEQEQWEKAIADFRLAVQRNPQSGDAWNNLAWILATCPDDKVRDGDAAVELATRACEISQWKDFTRLSTLAAAYAEVGEFAKAVEWQEKCLELMPAPQRPALTPALELYQQEKPYRMERKPQP
jgi:tetratricopeptide (TPR) repeat protein